MKPALATTGLSGIIAAAVAAGPSAIIGLAALLVTVFGIVCWIVANRDRTTNTVALITATRGNLPEVSETSPAPSLASSLRDSEEGSCGVA